MRRLYSLLLIACVILAVPIEAQASNSNTTDTTQETLKDSTQDEAWRRQGDIAFSAEFTQFYIPVKAPKNFSFGGGLYAGMYIFNNISLITGLGCYGSSNQEISTVQSGVWHETSTKQTMLAIPITLTGVIPFGPKSGFGIYTGPRFEFVVGYKCNYIEHYVNSNKTIEKNWTIDDLDKESKKGVLWGIGGCFYIRGFKVFTEYQGPIGKNADFKYGSVLIGLGIAM